MKRLLKKILFYTLSSGRISLCSEVPFKVFSLIYKNRHVSISKSRLIGDLSISEGVKINNALILGKVNIQKNSSIYGPGTVISSILGKIQIGSYVSIGQNVSIQESNHNLFNFTTYPIKKNLIKNLNCNDFISKGDIVIGNDVWIGSNSVILSGVRIGNGSIIAGGSVVTRNVEPYTIVAGNPAKFIKARFSKEKSHYLENSKWWEMTTEELAEWIGRSKNLIK